MDKKASRLSRYRWLLRFGLSVMIMLGLTAGTMITGSGVKVGSSPDRLASPVGIEPAAWTSLQDQIRKAEYYPTWHAPSQAYRAPNRPNGFELAFGTQGLQVESVEQPNDWTLRLSPSGYGAGETIAPLPGEPGMSVSRDRVEYHWVDPQGKTASLSAWYVNSADGLEQGFTLASPPEGNGDVVVEMRVGGDLTPRLDPDGQAVTFLPRQGSHEVLRYDKLVVTDVDDKEVPAHLELSGCGAKSSTTKIGCHLRIVVTAGTAHYPLTIDPLFYTNMWVIINLEEGAIFGSAVAISGDSLVIGAQNANGHRGTASILTRNSDTGAYLGDWSTITASDAAENDLFGRAVAIDNDRVVVGASFKGGGGWNRGAAYLYERNKNGINAWGEVIKFTASTPNDGAYYGNSLSIDGDTIVIGAMGDHAGGSYRGAAYVFSRNQGGANAWGQVVKLTASDAQDEDFFGSGVSINGDTIVVGAFGEDGTGSDQGAAYVFERNHGGMDAWGQVIKLTYDDPFDDAYFGSSVSISGDTLVVGADQHYYQQGAVYIFERNQNGANAWGQVVKLSPSPSGYGLFFGKSVDIDGDTVVVGATGETSGGNDAGATYVFERNRDGADAWGQVVKLTPEYIGEWDECGSAVAIDRGKLLIGIPGYDFEEGTETNNGLAVLYHASGAFWRQTDKQTAGDGASSDYFGWSVAVSGDTLVVGAPAKNSYTGAAYVFTRNQDGADAWGELHKLTAGDPATNDEFGRQVSISGDTLVVGARGEDGAGYIPGGCLCL